MSISYVYSYQVCLGKGLDADAEAGACLALLVLCDIICQNDAPIIRKSY